MKHVQGRCVVENMIESFSDLREYLKEDCTLCPVKDRVLLEHNVYIKRFLVLLRWDEFLSNSTNKILLPAKVFIRRRRNRLGAKLGFMIPVNTLGKGIKIWHYGNIVINGGVRLGERCVLHGDNCIGNDGVTNASPEIGNNVDIGVGAKIIGNIYIADNCRIGAGAVVVKSCYHKGTTLVGVPAKEIGEKK